MPARRDLWIGLLLALAGALVGPILRGVFGVAGPAGSDSDLWAFSAMNLSVGADPVVPPLYPWMMGVGAWATGEHPVDVGVLISGALMVFVGPLTYGLARACGGRPAWSALAGALVLVTPSVAGLAVQAQPDALNLLLFGACVLVARWVLAGPGPLSLVALAALAGLAPLVREHGTALLVLLLGVAALASGPAERRITRVIAVASAALVLPELMGLDTALWWEQPWMDRVERAVAVARGSSDASARLGFPEELGPALARRYEQGVIGIAEVNLRWILMRAPAEWGWLVLGTVLALRRRRWRVPLLVGLLPALGTFPFLPHPRHVAVALPVALAAWVAALARGGRATRGVLLAAGLGLALLGWSGWPFRLDQLRDAAERVAALRTSGEALCRVAAPGDLAAGEPMAFLFCPLPRHELQQDGGAADWHSWYAGKGAPAPGWVEQGPVGTGFRFYRLAATGERPCAGSRPVPGTPYVSAVPAPATMLPACREGEVEAPAEPQRERTRLKPGGAIERH